MSEEPPDNLVRVVADVHGDDPWSRTSEGLWAEPLGGDRYRLWNVPWHARGLNWGDVVRCEDLVTEARGDHLHIVEVVERSGHVGFSIFFSRDCPEAARDEVLDRLERMGAWFEWYAPGGEGGGRLYALDVPPDASWHHVYECLVEAERRDILGCQTSWLGDEPEMS